MNASQKMASALQAYLLTLQYAQDKVNPEEWESHIDWDRLGRDAREALNAYENEVANKRRELG